MDAGASPRPRLEGPSASAGGPSACPTRRALIRSVARGVARLYFDVSYRLLSGSVAGRRVLALPAAGGGPVHGYFTLEDREALLASLDPAPGDRLLDLGSGLGGIAIELHRRSGAGILGIDISPRAVSAATARARHERVDGRVGFRAGDLARPPRLGATSAYAIDSLMFVPDLAGALRGIGDALGPGGRLFATLLVPGVRADVLLHQAIRDAGADLERLDDVTTALLERSRARADAAALLRGGPTATLRGRLAMRLVGAEERLVQARVASSRLTRWRFVVRFGSTPERDAAHIGAMEEAA